MFCGKSNYGNLWQGRGIDVELQEWFGGTAVSTPDHNSELIWILDDAPSTEQPDPIEIDLTAYRVAFNNLYSHTVELPTNVRSHLIRCMLIGAQCLKTALSGEQLDDNVINAFAHIMSEYAYLIRRIRCRRSSNLSLWLTVHRSGSVAMIAEMWMFCYRISYYDSMHRIPKKTWFYRIFTFLKLHDNHRLNFEFRLVICRARHPSSTTDEWVV